MPRTEIVLSVQGGLVQDVYCSDPDVQIVLVDWDVEESDPDAPKLVEIRTSDGRAARAYVASLDVCPLANLAGTEIEQALEAAEVRDGTPQT